MSAALPTVRLAAHEMVSSMGHHPEAAVSFLSAFKKLATTQLEVMASAAGAGDWAPQRAANEAGALATTDRTLLLKGLPRDRSNKSVRSVAHATKGAAGIVGAHRLVAASLALQNACEPLSNAAAMAAEREHARAALAVWRTEVNALVGILEVDEPEKLLAREGVVLVAPSDDKHRLEEGARHLEVPRAPSCSDEMAEEGL